MEKHAIFLFASFLRFAHPRGLVEFANGPEIRGRTRGAEEYRVILHLEVLAAGVILAEISPEHHHSITFPEVPFHTFSFRTQKGRASTNTKKCPEATGMSGSRNKTEKSDLLHPNLGVHSWPPFTISHKTTADPAKTHTYVLFRSEFTFNRIS